MKSSEWVMNQLKLYLPYSELCLFYLRQFIKIYSSDLSYGTEFVNSYFIALNNHLETREIGAVVEAINTHINNTDVCYAGCGALMSMTSNNGKNNNKTINKISKQLRTK